LISDKLNPSSEEWNPSSEEWNPSSEERKLSSGKWNPSSEEMKPSEKWNASLEAHSFGASNGSVYHVRSKQMYMYPDAGSVFK
jgi:hypothetical protein